MRMKYGGPSQTKPLKRPSPAKKQDPDQPACECCGEQKPLLRGLCHSCTRTYFEDAERELKAAKHDLNVERQLREEDAAVHQHDARLFAEADDTIVKLGNALEAAEAAVPPEKPGECWSCKRVDCFGYDKVAMLAESELGDYANALIQDFPCWLCGGDAYLCGHERPHSVKCTHGDFDCRNAHRSIPIQKWILARVEAAVKRAEKPTEERTTPALNPEEPVWIGDNNQVAYWRGFRLSIEQRHVGDDWAACINGSYVGGPQDRDPNTARAKAERAAREQLTSQLNANAAARHGIQLSWQDRVLELEQTLEQQYGWHQETADDLRRELSAAHQRLQELEPDTTEE